MTDIEKMDELKMRFDITYAQAKEALEQSGGDLGDAIVYLESNDAKPSRASGGRSGQARGGNAGKRGSGANKSDDATEGDNDNNTSDKQTAGNTKQDTEAFVKSIIEQVKAIIKEGNVTKVRLKKGEQTLIEIPATIGVVGLGIMLFSPLMLAFTAIGAVAAVAQEMVFEIEKSDGTIERRYLKWPEVVSEKQYGNDD